MEFEATELMGVWLIRPQRYGDSRGYFMESYRADLFREYIGAVDFVQDNESVSTRGVLRGLHYQRGSASQAKLVRVSRGVVLDVAVDLRRSSPTFLKHIAVELSADNGLQLFIPRGFAHGFLVLSDTAQFQYKVDNIYSPSAEMSILYNDPMLGIKWPMETSEMVLSAKDISGVTVDQAEMFD